MLPTDHEARAQAIGHRTGPLEVMAGHGTGKTTLLLERYARLIKDQVAWAHEVVLLTFTRRAASEMRERLQLLLGEDIDGLPIFTLHAFAKHILTTAAGRNVPFKILDPNQAFKVLQNAIADVRLPAQVWPPILVASLIADAKERGIAPEDFVTVPDSSAQQAIGRAYTRYQERLASNHAHDFADLVIGAVRLLESQPELLEQVRQRYRFVMVDEFQDTALGQYRLIHHIVGLERNLFVVGSKAQSIYEWRQANYARLAEQFYADFPDAQCITLRDNFRSTAPIVRAAAALLDAKHYPDVDLLARRGPGERIRDVRVANERDEAMFVADEVTRLADSGFAFNDIAVLYRTSRQNTSLEQELTRRHIPYVIPQRQRLYHRREVRDVLAYLSLAVNDDEAALVQIINTPPRGLGPVSLRILQNNQSIITLDQLRHAAEHGQAMGLRPQAIASVQSLLGCLQDLNAQARASPPAALMDVVLERTGYRTWLLEELDGESRLNSIRTLQREAEDYAMTTEFLAAIREHTEADLERPEDEGVTLLTIHSAKGLQFKAVFVIGMEEGLLPHARAVESGAEVGERRLAHVAFSRARDRLYLISAQSREHAGRRLYPRPSRYLSALPPEIVLREKHRS